MTGHGTVIRKEPVSLTPNEPANPFETRKKVCARPRGDRGAWLLVRVLVTLKVQPIKQCFRSRPTRFRATDLVPLTDATARFLAEVWRNPARGFYQVCSALRPLGIGMSAAASQMRLRSLGNWLKMSHASPSWPVGLFMSVCKALKTAVKAAVA